MRIKSPISILLAGLALCFFTAVGCDDSGVAKPGSGTSTSHDDHDDHDHSHEDGEHDDEEDDHPDHGPFGGHLFSIDSDQYQGEWKKYKDNDLIRMYVLDAAGKNAVAIKADSFVVIPQAGSGEEKFELEAEKPDEKGAASVYMLEDKALSMAIPLGVDIEIKIGDKVIKGQIKAHKPLDH